MKVISRPRKEAVVLAAVKKKANAKEIHKGIVARAENCVDHLCGCSSGC